MQVSKWGSSLAIRLPAAVVSALGLKAGDEVAIEVADPHRFGLARDPGGDAALETLRALGWTLPADFRFSRDDANARGARPAGPAPRSKDLNNGQVIDNRLRIRNPFAPA